MRNLTYIIVIVGLLFSSKAKACQGLYEQFYKDSSQYNVTFYDINLTFSDTSTYIKGSVRIHAIPVNKALTVFYTELSAYLTVDSIICNNSILEYKRFGNLLQIQLNEVIPVDSVFAITFYYHGNAYSDSPMSGTANNTDPNYPFKVTYTLSEPFYTSDWLPCKQELDDKIDSVNLNITVPKGRKAASNGLLKTIEHINSFEDRYCWESRYPVAYYLLSVTVSDYQDYSYYIHSSLNSDSILFQNYIYNSTVCLNENKLLIDRTVEIFHFFESILGEYPFKEEKYGHTLAPISGGMENQTMTTINGFGFNIVAHELAHSWFGNSVTCTDWQNIWINEGFASYCEYLAIENLISSDDAKGWMTEAHRWAGNEPNGSVYIPSYDKFDVWQIFSGNLSYKKGAILLHMIRKRIDNDELFFKIIKQYYNKYAYKNASANDFKNLVEEKTGIDFTYFFNQWYYGNGYPEFNIKWNFKNDTLYIESFEKGTDPETPFFNVKLNYLIHFYYGKDSMITLEQNKPLELYKISLNRKVKSIEPDPEKNILKSLSILRSNNFDSNIRLYPNPCSDSVSIDFKSIDKDRIIEIYDMKGNIILSSKHIENPITISLKAIVSGVYFLRVIDDTEKYVLKIVKN
jgi:aminopeptidase N